MRRLFQGPSLAMAVFAWLLAMALLLPPSSFAEHSHTSKPFQGIKVNGGTVAHTRQGMKQVLTLSDDFQIPDTPDPHWQVVDSQGRVYPLDRLKVKPDKFNKSITLPDYVPDVAKVQIWCSFAETLLGEASFAAPVK